LKGAKGLPLCTSRNPIWLTGVTPRKPNLAVEQEQGKHVTRGPCDRQPEQAINNETTAATAAPVKEKIDDGFSRVTIEP